MLAFATDSSAKTHTQSQEDIHKVNPLSNWLSQTQLQYLTDCLCCGGSTCIPKVQQLLKECFGRSLQRVSTLMKLLPRGKLPYEGNG